MVNGLNGVVDGVLEVLDEVVVGSLESVVVPDGALLGFLALFELVDDHSHVAVGPVEFLELVV